MKQQKKATVRLTHISEVIELTPHLRRIIVAGESLKDFPTGMEGAHVKVVLQQGDESEAKMRSYTIRSFNPERNELAIDFVVNRHNGPATNWAMQAKVEDSVGIAGPGPMKITNYNHSSYLLVGDLTSLNAINGYLPRFEKATDIRVILAVPNRADIIEMDYDDSLNTEWFIEDEAMITLEEKVIETARGMPKDTHVFLALEASCIRSLRPVLQEDIGFDRLNTVAVGYWKRGVDADRFGAQKKKNPL
ncbi:MAG: NADPH-dependent ferric siderophore reductase [Psychromonas sp.]|jgi:NADPH-dependent ferric siderophore reductase|uniref:siderophore-interacting protein n=1 Tax=Psychromonas sp. TaxID=1884585 RepID=UPI0039E51B7C